MLEAAPKPEKPKKKKSRKRRRANKDDDFYMDSKGIVDKLKKRYGKKNNADDEEIIKRSCVRAGKIVASTKYSRYIEKARSTQINRSAAPPDPPDDLIPTYWVCALCSKNSCDEAMGDLFGPYYVELPPDSGPPPEWLLKPEAGQPTSGWIDVFVHGRCALWAENFFLHGPRILELSALLYKYWSLECDFCHELGASVIYNAAAGIAHYPCLVHAGFQFDAEDFSIRRPPHFCLPPPRTSPSPSAEESVETKPEPTPPESASTKLSPATPASSSSSASRSKKSARRRISATPSTSPPVLRRSTRHSGGNASTPSTA